MNVCTLGGKSGSLAFMETQERRHLRESALKDARWKRGNVERWKGEKVEGASCKVQGARCKVEGEWWKLNGDR